MTYFARSAFEYIQNQMMYQSTTAGRLLFMMPSVPPAVALEIGDRLSQFCGDLATSTSMVLKIASPLIHEWETSGILSDQTAVRKVSERGWRDDNDNLTIYRNAIADAGGPTVLLLIGVDRVTDASSLADFHHCDYRTIWQEELQGSFTKWIRASLEAHGIGFEEHTIQHFDWILQPLFERGLTDLLDVSTLLQNLDLSAAQDGRDAEKVLLTSLNRFGLPDFGAFNFAGRRSFETYLDDALAFFSYSAFLDDRNRERALKAIREFAEANPTSNIFEQAERKSFSSDEEVLRRLIDYVGNGDQTARTALLSCDFVIVRDQILAFRAPRQTPPRKETTRKLNGGPVDVVLSALWATLGEFKQTAEDRGVFALDVLREIVIESQLFKHDCDGDSSLERTENARRYLARLVGGVDRLLQNGLDSSILLSESTSVKVRSALVQPELECQSARNSEPHLIFRIVLLGVEGESRFERRFAWRLPEAQPYRVADELMLWAASAIQRVANYCLPSYHVPYYEELLLAKDEEETRRVLLQCIHDDVEGPSNLLTPNDLDPHDPLLPKLKDLALKYDAFLQDARAEGLHGALLNKWDELRKAYELASSAYLTDPACAGSPLATMMYRAFLILKRHSNTEQDQWMWQGFESSCAVTVLHPALLEMFQARILYLLAAFITLAKRELISPGSRAFRQSVWQGFLDLAAIQMPIAGLIKDSNRILDTSVRGEGLVHRIGSVVESDTSLTTRLLLRYDAFDEEDISDAELFRKGRESVLISRILKDYWKLHPHADDGLSIAVYQNLDIQPVIAAIDEYLEEVCQGRQASMKPYALAVTILTESSDDSSVAQWISHWKERWEAAEAQENLARYRQTQLSVAHRIVAPDNHYRQFKQLIVDGLQVDIAILNGFIRAGMYGNDFELVEPYDVTSRTLKFPILEKSFCSLRDPGRRLQRARVLSNRQFRMTTYHAEIMARLKNRETPQNSHHVVLGYGDYTPWLGVIDALHQKAEWVVCIDPNIDERLIAEKGTNQIEVREIIGFGSGVGAHGEANFTISTEQFRFSDVLHMLKASIGEIYSGWSPPTYQTVAESILKESRSISGLSLVRATGIGQYIRDFMAYALCRKLLHVKDEVICDQLVSLDAYRHWFDSAESETRPDLLWIVTRLGTDGRLHLDLRLIECKLAKMSDTHLDKARQQLESGLNHLSAVFMPRVSLEKTEDERPDQRYWWLQLHRLIASKAEIKGNMQRSVLSALERLSEGDYDLQWHAAAITYWTDQTADNISEADVWPFSINGQDVGISVVTSGSELVRHLCEKGGDLAIPWSDRYASFKASRSHGENESSIPLGPTPEDGSGPTAIDPHSGVPSSKVKVADEKLRENSHIEHDGTTVSSAIAERVLLGTTIGGNRKVFWEFGHKDLNNRHILLFGSSGMGKTYTIQALLLELGRSGQNSLIVDYTSGFFDNQLEPEFKARLSPIQHIIRKKPLAINPFRQQGELINDELLLEPTTVTAQRVSGVFSGVYKFGDQQKSALYQVIKSSIEQIGDRAMTLEYLVPLLEAMADQKGIVGQSAASVASKIRPFVDQNPFGFEDPKGWDALLTDTKHRCHIIQLAGLLKDAARLVTEFSLLDLYWFYRTRSTQSSPHVVVLDEVQNLDHREESPLAQMLREGRKFGFSLILATQTISNLEKEERDRLFNAAHKLFFRPADTEIKSFAEIASITTGEKIDVWLERLAALNKGECYSLGPSLNSATHKLEVKAFRIRVTALADRTTDA